MNAESDDGWAIAKWLWENRQWIQQRYQKLRQWLSSSAPTESAGDVAPILFLGPGGVGKSTCAGLLCSADKAFEYLGSPYDESLGVEHYSLDGPAADVIVLPGQRHRRDVAWPELEASVADGSIRGVILFVSYGYHSIGLASYRSHRLYKSGMEREEFLTEYLKASRQDELSVLERIASSLRRAPRPCWLLTVVTKQDLWWSEREDVSRFYSAGRFAGLLGEVQSTLGARNFRHELVYVTLTIRNFETGEGELLQANTAGYDDGRRVQALRGLYEMLDSLRLWEGSKR